MQILLSLIQSLKNEQFEANVKLHALHHKMQIDYQVLCVETQRTKLQEDGCLREHDILKMMADYRIRSAEYNKKNSKLMDITARIMTLEQRYNTLGMTLAATSSPTTASVPKTNARKTLLDGIQRRNKYQKPSNLLPVIVEDESESDVFEWEQCSDVCHGGLDGHNDICSVGSDESLETKQPRVHYQEDLETITGHSEIADSDIINGTPSWSPEPPSTQSWTSELSDTYSVSGGRDREETSFDLPMANSVVLDQVHSEMADILEMVTYQSTEAIQRKMDQLLGERGDTVAVLVTVIICIINTAVDSKPRLSTVCAKKYSALCWSVLNYCESVYCDRVRTKDLRPSSLEEIKNLDIEQLLEQQLYDTFCVLQKEADPVKFVNICVLMAELYNGNLLHCSMILKVVEAILGEQTICRIGRNDIDGLHEIFKRSSVSLRNSSVFQRQQIKHYLKKLRTLRNQSKFNTKPYRKTLYLIDQIQRHFYC